MNDPQRPFFLDGLWHFYYLYNADYPDGNGTEWYHATSTDLVHWKDEGIAIEKYKNGLGDIWTGSAVVDIENTAGFGKNAVISLVTQQVDGVQRQSLFYSTDGGYSFSSYDGNPVMDNPGVEAWRDPKVVWDKERNQWLMLLAEGNKVGFYTSKDLRSWDYQSGFETTDLGVVECPDFFPMSVDGDPQRTMWVLGISANGANSGRTTGYTYWTGSFDGKSFKADEKDPRWLDAGSDFYAAVTWDDPAAQDPTKQRYALGWMNNWAYAGDLPLGDWAGGTMSTVRQLSLRDVDGHAQLFSKPIDALEKLEGEAVVAQPGAVAKDQEASLGKAESDAYRFHVDLSQDQSAPAEETQVQLKDAQGSTVTVGYNFNDQTLFLNRDNDKAAGNMPESYREVRSEKLPVDNGQLSLDILVDTTSIEVFAEDGQATLSSTAFLSPGDHELSLKSFGGTTDMRESSTTPLAVAETQRQ
ncbi:glycoside hydrolase family 32 protein [Glutamicibacter sp. JL.03c]|uniref:glycoside hydrolase family 32 protein n=1 Tax=Glutamicibacter sp. JL.03c TaxID=2984842 RepID=UPI0021F7CC90|nr:glycoside hydrolase family 32 protein [Glutamicibacter sp. JL.03c]UYQ78503.1 glycoside hydrolase family 32 protein [Glutamicibacter sp. JL.03c]